MSIFSERLKELRLQHNLSMAQLAQKTGITDATICKWENDLTEPKASNLLSIAHYFEVSIDFLLGLENDFGAKMYDTPKPLIKCTSQKESTFLMDYRKLPEELRHLAEAYVKKLVALHETSIPAQLAPAPKATVSPVAPVKKKKTGIFPA